MPDRWYAARINVIPVPIKFLEQGAHPYAYAIKNLERQELPAYCPLIYIFRSYLFVLFDLAELRWRKVNSTRGVMPTHAEQPQPLPDGFIEGLRVAEAERAAAAIVGVVQTFATNAIVRIPAGALQGRQGRVLSSSRQTTRVEVELFGREVTATVETEELEEVDPDC